MDRPGHRIRFAAACLLGMLQACGGDSGDAGGGGVGTTPPIAPGALSGLDSRPANSSCLAGDAPSGVVSLAVERVFPNLAAFSSPVLMLQEPASSARWYVVEKTGTVQVFDNQPNVSAKRLFINVTAQIAGSATDERGLLGMAFHPGWPANPRVYLSYTANAGGLVSRIVEYQSRDGGQTLDAGSGVVILQTYQPESNHNGGNIVFGPDGFLYIGLGDGGSQGDPNGNGQNKNALLGKILRLDVSGGGETYAVPPSNPFAGQAGARGEVWAYGFRNPWRFTFDRATGDLYIGDVGQNAYEEIDYQPAASRGGENYGWNLKEGLHPYRGSAPAGAQLVDPVAEYSHDV